MDERRASLQRSTHRGLAGLVDAREAGGERGPSDVQPSAACIAARRPGSSVASGSQQVRQERPMSKDKDTKDDSHNHRGLMREALKQVVVREPKSDKGSKD